MPEGQRLGPFGVRSLPRKVRLFDWIASNRLPIVPAAERKCLAH